MVNELPTQNSDVLCEDATVANDISKFSLGHLTRIANERLVNTKFYDSSVLSHALTFRICDLSPRCAFLIENNDKQIKLKLTFRQRNKKRDKIIKTNLEISQT